jgi:hypothetical protein
MRPPVIELEKRRVVVQATHASTPAGIPRHVSGASRLS